MWKSGVLYLVCLAILWGQSGLATALGAFFAGSGGATVGSSLLSATTISVGCWLVGPGLRAAARLARIAPAALRFAVVMSLGCLFVRVAGELAVGEAFMGYPAVIVAAAVTALAHLAPSSEGTAARATDADTVF